METYAEQLQTISWKLKRFEILVRDQFKCKECLNENIISQKRKGIISKRREDGRYVTFRDLGDFIEITGKVNDELFELCIPNRVAYFSDEKTNGYLQLTAIRNITPDEKKLLEEYKSSLSQIGFEISAVSLYQKLIHEMSVKAKMLDTKLDKLKWHYVGGLHIHHTYYQKGRLPWEYPNNSLDTLCWLCHEKIHQNTTIEVKDPITKKSEFMKRCSKCHGAGIIPYYHHISSGICFSCNGVGYTK
jgi:hypothetical protein